MMAGNLQQTPEAISERIVENRAQQNKELEEQASRLVEDARNHEQEAARHGDASRQQSRGLERARRKLEDRRLRLLERDEEYVRSALQRREKLSNWLPTAIGEMYTGINGPGIR